MCIYHLKAVSAQTPAALDQDLALDPRDTQGGSRQGQEGDDDAAIDMLAGSNKESQKSFSEKVIPMNTKLKPGDIKGWATFTGEFKSLIHTDALAALNRNKHYSFSEVQRMSPKADSNTQAMIMQNLNDRIDEASEYIYRNIYANTDFTVPSHGPTLMKTIARNYEDTRDGIALFHHLKKSYDKRNSEKGQEDLDKEVTPERIRARLSGAVTPTLLETIIYSMHDDWARIDDNVGKAITKLIKVLLRQMKTLPHTEMSQLAFQHITAMDAPGATTKQGSVYADLTSFVDALSTHWPSVTAGSINVVHGARPGGPQPQPGSPGRHNPTKIPFSPKTATGAARGQYNSSTNNCDTCPLFTCFARSNLQICQACGDKPAAFPDDASSVQRQIGNATRLYAKQNGLKTVKEVKVGTMVTDMKNLRDSVAKDFPNGKVVPQVKMTLSPHVSAAACAALQSQLETNEPIVDFTALEKAMEEANLTLAAEGDEDDDLVVPLGDLMPRLNVTAHPGDIDEALNALSNLEEELDAEASPEITINVSGTPPPPPDDTPPVAVPIIAPPPPPPAYTPPALDPVAALSFQSGSDSGGNTPRSPSHAASVGPRTLREAQRLITAGGGDSARPPADASADEMAAVARHEARLQEVRERAAADMSRLDAQLQEARDRLAAEKDLRHAEELARVRSDEERRRGASAMELARGALTGIKRLFDSGDAVNVSGGANFADNFLVFILKRPPLVRKLIMISFLLAVSTTASKFTLFRRIPSPVTTPLVFAFKTSLAACRRLIKVILAGLAVKLSKMAIETNEDDDEVDALARAAADSIGDSALMMQGKATLLLSDGAATDSCVRDKSWIIPGTERPSEVGELASCEQEGGITASIQGMMPLLLKVTTAKGAIVPRFIFRIGHVCDRLRDPIFSEPNEKVKHSSFIDESKSPIEFLVFNDGARTKFAVAPNRLRFLVLQMKPDDAVKFIIAQNTFVPPAMTIHETAEGMCTSSTNSSRPRTAWAPSAPPPTPTCFRSSTNTGTLSSRSTWTKSSAPRAPRRCTTSSSPRSPAASSARSSATGRRCSASR